MKQISAATRLAKLTAWLVCTWVVAITARAEPGSRPAPLYNARLTLGPGVMVSSDQLSQLKLDRVALLADIQVARTLKPWLELRASFDAGAFRSGTQRTGGMIAPTLGAAFQVPDRAIRPWVGIDVGPGITGSSVRPFVDVMFGFDARVDKRTSVGPVLAYGRMIQWNGAHYTTDASYFWLGLTFRVRFDAPPPPPPPKPLVRRVHTYHREVVHTPPESTVSTEEVLRMIEQAVPTVTQRTELLAPVLFKFDSDTLEPIGVAMLHEVAHQLQTRPDIKLLEIQGYADARGSAEYNEALSSRRAERVQSWLIEHGVAQERLRVAARGAAAPVEAGQEEGAYEQNRRVIFRVIEQGDAP